MPGFSVPDAILTVADVARIRTVGRVSAYRWLHRNAARYLRRDGRRVVIRTVDYVKLAGGPIDPRIDDRFTDLESRMDEVEHRVNALARRAW
jgi:hypothetical protein